MQDLRNELEGTRKEVRQLKVKNELVKQAVNSSTFEVDSLQQYSRRENIRIHGVPLQLISKLNGTKDGGETVIRKVAEELKV